MLRVRDPPTQTLAQNAPQWKICRKRILKAQKKWMIEITLFFNSLALVRPVLHTLRDLKPHCYPNPNTNYKNGTKFGPRIPNRNTETMTTSKEGYSQV